jgi:ABC-2 type transport system ATP-binding protein
VIIIDKGVEVANEEKNKIYSILTQQKQVIHVEFDKEIKASELETIANISSIKQINNNSWLIESDGIEDVRPALFAFAVKNNLTVLSLRKEESNLEDVFRHLTNG